MNCSHDTVRGENGRLVCVACDAPIKIKANKFHNELHRGYASRKEANTSAKLHALQAAGKISNLEEQVKFELVSKDGDWSAISYVADWTFIDRGAGYGPIGSLVVMDAKGFKTPVYKQKRRLMKYFHNITIVEV